MSFPDMSTQRLPRLSIIIPFTEKGDAVFIDVVSHYDDLVRKCRDLLTLDIIIVDSSPSSIYLEHNDLLVNSAIIHLMPPRGSRRDNDKLNNVEAGIAASKMPYIMLIDDDGRPDKDAILAIMQYMGQSCIVKCMISFVGPNVYDLLDLAGAYVINTISPDKQFYANITFHASLLTCQDFFRKDILFDDLAVYRHCQRQADKSRGDAEIPRNRFVYIASPAMKVTGSKRGFVNFLGQRIRWSYENAAYPFRFMVFLGSPLITYCWQSMVSGYWALSCLAALNLFVLFCGLMGQQRYGPEGSPRWAWLLSLLWFWICVVTTWLALWYVITGCPFAGARYRTPCIFPRVRDWFSW